MRLAPSLSAHAATGFAPREPTLPRTVLGESFPAVAPHEGTLGKRPGASALGSANLVRPFTAPATMPEAADGQGMGAGMAPHAALEDLRQLLRLGPPGEPAPAALRREMEASTGRSLAAARVHRGPAADQIAGALGTAGLSVGQDVVLGASASARVLRHELAHVAQRNGRGPDLDRPLALGGRAAAAEREADALSQGGPGATTPDGAPNTVRRDGGCASCHQPSPPPGGGVDPLFQPLLEYPPSTNPRLRLSDPGDVFDDMNRRLVDQARRHEARLWQECPKGMCHAGTREALLGPWANAQLLYRPRGPDWGALVAEQKARDLATQGADLQEDIERGELSVAGAQAAALRKVAARLPEGLDQSWIEARQSMELLAPALKTEAVSVEVQQEVRPRLNRFYWGMLRLQLEREAQDAWLAAEYAQRAAMERKREAALWQSCPKQMCHAGPRESLLGPRLYLDVFRAPPPFSPSLRTYIERVDSAATVAAWRQVEADFSAASGHLTTAVVGMLPHDAPEREALVQSQGLLARQRELLARRSDAVKIPAVFYPEGEVEPGQGEGGRTRYFARGLPWFFYLYREGATWVLEDLVTGRKVNRHDPSLQQALEEFIRGREGLSTKDPPPDLFDQLNAKIRFPRGVLHLTLPSRKVHSVQMTEPWEWSEILGIIGISLAALGLVLGTAGFGTPAAVALIASAGAGALSTYAGLQEKELHGLATNKDRRDAAILIAADVASALSLGLGRLAGSASMAARLGRTATLAGRLWAPVTAASFLLDGAGIYVMTETFVDQYRALEAQPGLSPADRDRARKRLVLTAMIGGGLSLVSLRSTGRELRGGLPLHLDATPGGTRVRPDSPALRPGAAVRELPAAGPTGGLRWKAPAPEMRGLDESLGAGDILIRVQRGDDGLVQAIEVSHGPKPRGAARLRRWEADLALHQEIADKLQRYGGLQGRIRQIFATIAQRLGARPRGPLELELELYKLERTIENRMRLLERGRLSARVRREVEDEIARIRTQLDEVERRLAAPNAKDWLLEEGKIFVRGKPAGYPQAPANHVYYRRSDGRWDLAPEVPGRGPQFRVEFDAAGKPTGRITNGQQLADSGVLGKALDDTTRQQLRDMGYSPKSNDQIARPPDHSGGADRPFMEPLTVRIEPDGSKRIVIAEVESFAESQQRLEAGLGRSQARRLATVRQRALKAEEPGEVVLLRGTYDTQATWADVLALGTREQDLLQGLIRRGVSRAKARELVDALKNKPGTIKVVLGTEPLRRYPYRTRYGEAGGTLAKGRPVHHFDPLYLGGQHKLLLDLPTDAHDWVHAFFDNLTLPSKSPLAGTRLEPNTLQAAVPSWRPSAATLHPSGEVSYDVL